MNDEQLIKTRAEFRARSLASLKKVVAQARVAGLHELADQTQAQIDAHEKRTGLGDIVAGVTKAVGIEPCDDCKKRKAAMNQVDLGRPALEVAKGLLRAIFHPDDALRSSS